MSNNSFGSVRVAVLLLVYIALHWLAVSSVLAAEAGTTESYYGWRFEREPDGGWTIWRQEAQQVPKVSPRSPATAGSPDKARGVLRAQDVPGQIPGWEVRRQSDGSTLLIPRSPDRFGAEARTRSVTPAPEHVETGSPRHLDAAPDFGAQQQLELIRDVFGDAAYPPAN
ncbi:MAG: hypothetical protein ABFS23_09360 [Pseudomonadota bacterium]